MSSTIEDILHEAHEQGKRGELIKSLNEIRRTNPNVSLTELYQLAYEQLK
jgi:hypothetical protein